MQSIVVGLALIVLGGWCIYKGSVNWRDRNEYPALGYVAWGIFSILTGLLAVYFGYKGWWWSY